MASAKEIIAYTKTVRGKNGEWVKGHTDIGPSVNGHCVQVVDIVEQFNGQHWRSPDAKYPPEQVYPGHSLGIIPTRGNAGIVIEYSRAHNFVRGSIKDIHDTETTKAELKKISGYPGWEKMGR